MSLTSCGYCKKVNACPHQRTVTNYRKSYSCPISRQRILPPAVHIPTFDPILLTGPPSLISRPPTSPADPPSYSTRPVIPPPLLTSASGSSLLQYTICNPFTPTSPPPAGPRPRTAWRYGRPAYPLSRGSADWGYPGRQIALPAAADALHPSRAPPGTGWPPAAARTTPQSCPGHAVGQGPVTAGLMRLDGSWKRPL